LHTRPDEQERLTSAEHRLHEQVTEPTVGVDDRRDRVLRYPEDRTGLSDDAGDVDPLAGEQVELGDEIAGPERHDRPARPALGVERLDLTLENDHEVVGEVAGGGEDLAG
jgi:hypothetical protein